MLHSCTHYHHHHHSLLHWRLEVLAAPTLSARCRKRSPPSTALRLLTRALLPLVETTTRPRPRGLLQAAPLLRLLHPPQPSPQLLMMQFLRWVCLDHFCFPQAQHFHLTSLVVILWISRSSFFCSSLQFSCCRFARLSRVQLFLPLVS